MKTTFDIYSPSVLVPDRVPLVAVCGVEIAFAGHRVVSSVDLTIRAGERWGLIGESGSGKTVTASTIAGLAPRRARVSGSVRLDGCELVGARESVLAGLRGATVAMTVQESSTALHPLVRVGRQVRGPVRRVRGCDRRGADAVVEGLLASVGLEDPATVARSFPSQLSGGQRQRAALAMALASEPRLLVADEPTTALDPPTTQGILRLLDAVLSSPDRESAPAPALLLVSHDLGVVAQLCTHIAVMHGGRIVERGPVVDVLAGATAQHTRDLIDAAALLDLTAVVHR